MVGGRNRQIVDQSRRADPRCCEQTPLAAGVDPRSQRCGIDQLDIIDLETGGIQRFARCRQRALGVAAARQELREMMGALALPEPVPPLFA